MSEQKQYRDRPYAYDFDAEWDVEKALLGKNDPVREKQEPVYRRSTSPGTNRQRRPSGKKRRRSPARGKRSGANLRGWLILGGIGLAILLIIVLLISLIVSALTSSEQEIPVETRPHYTEEASGESSYTPTAEELLIQKADRVAAGYDYNGAVDVLRTYGADWESNASLAAARDRYLALKDSAVAWDDPAQVPHLAFHTLVADPERAFNSVDGVGFNQNMVTVDEFRGILTQLYNNGYVLVNLHQFARYGMDEDGKQTYLPGNINLPEGKTPIILSQDDVNYYEYMVDTDGDRLADAGNGFASRIVIDADGSPTCEYYTASGELVTGEYDLVPVLEAFIQEHPDFSYKGARAVLSVTGFEGVFGYRTHPEWRLILGEGAYKEEVRAAQDVARCLREHGWELASHSFAHTVYSELTDEELASDVKKWENQVQPIVGDSDIFVFPYGGDIEDNEDVYSSDAYDLLYDAGYRYFLNISSGENFAQLTRNYVRQGRRYVDGYTMLFEPEQLSDLFDVSVVLDSSRPVN